MITLTPHSNHSIRLVQSKADGINLFDLSDYIRSLNMAFIEDVIPSKTELMVCLNTDIDHENQSELIQQIKKFNPHTITPQNKTSITLSAKINKTIDLKAILESKAMSINEFMDLLNDSKIKLDMFGFLPGFMYLSGLNKSLAMPRKDKPTTQCPANALAIGGPYLGIYKYPSPAGWHIIGTIDNLPELKDLHQLQRGSIININFIYEPAD